MNNILLELEQDFLTFDKLDKIFKELLPKDIVKYIFDLLNPICFQCFNCCSVCRIYCYFNCLREQSGRDVCNLAEFNQTFSRYYSNDENTEEKKNN